MNKRTWAAAAVLLASSAAWSAAGQYVGTTLRPHGIKDLAGTTASDIGQYEGRLVLLEFFAYW